MLGEMHNRSIPVGMGTDDHNPYRVPVNSTDALETVRDAGYTQVSVFLGRVRTDLPIEQVRSSLKITLLAAEFSDRL